MVPTVLRVGGVINSADLPSAHDGIMMFLDDGFRLGTSG